MVGVFDLGSNSFISLVVNGREELHEEVVVTQAVSHVKNGKFTDCSALKKTFDSMLEKVYSFTQNVHVFGTAVFRETENGKWCFEEIKGGLPGRILSGEEEARYSYLSVLWDEEIGVEDPLVFDLGGGSLEVVGAERVVSLPLGTRKVGRVSRENLRDVVDFVKSRLPRFFGKPVGIGGTFVTIAAFKVGEWNLRAVHGAVLKKRDVQDLIDLIIDKTPEEIDSLPFVPEGRGRTLKEGCAIALAIIEEFGPLVVSRRGYRYALAWELEGAQ